MTVSRSSVKSNSKEHEPTAQIPPFDQLVNTADMFVLALVTRLPYTVRCRRFEVETCGLNFYLLHPVTIS